MQVMLSTDAAALVQVAYIDTEGTFRPERIAPIAARYNLDLPSVLDNVRCACCLMLAVYAASLLLLSLQRPRADMLFACGLTQQWCRSYLQGSTLMSSRQVGFAVADAYADADAVACSMAPKHCTSAVRLLDCSAAVRSSCCSCYAADVLITLAAKMSEEHFKLVNSFCPHHTHSCF